LTASLPTMTVTEPVVAAVLGIVVLGESVRPGDAGAFILVAAVGVMVLATTALARGQAIAVQVAGPVGKAATGPQREPPGR